MLAAWPTVALRAPTSPMEAAPVVGIAPLAKAALNATRTPPVAPWAVLYASPAAAAAAAVGAWEAFLRE